MNLGEFENEFEKKVAQIASTDDPAHDLLHFKRVVATAKRLCVISGARAEVAVPAAWLHDLIIVAKNDPRRKQASRLSAEAAIIFLKQITYPEIYFKDIDHAIEAHSFSAAIEPQSLEAKVVQDADRLDAVGAIGIARCFAVAGVLKRAFYSETDAFCESRDPDDMQFTLDHFYTKLLKVVSTLNTDAGRAEGRQRLGVMERFLIDLKGEIMTP